MKKFILFFAFTTLINIMGTAQTCGNFTVKLEDSWIGGWEGGYLDIYINGVSTISGITMLHSVSPVWDTIPANNGDVISIYYAMGSNASENKYTVYDQTGTVVAVEGLGLLIPKSIGQWSTQPYTGLTACASACPTPDSLSVNNIATTSADLSWVEQGTSTSWEIEWGPKGFTQGTGNAVVIPNITTNPYTLTGLLGNTSYDYYVRSNCGGTAYTQWSMVEEFTTSGFAGLEDNLDEIDINLFPNPNNGVFQLEVSTMNVMDLEINVINTLGQVVFTKTSTKNSTHFKEKIDLSKSAKGVYYVRVSSNEGAITRKLVIE